MTTALLFTDRARPRREHLLRDYPSRAICDLIGDGRRRRRRSRGPRRARHVVTRPRVASTINDPPPPPRAAQVRLASGESTEVVVVVNGEPACVDRGVRNASLAIYVLRHTSSPALTPAHPPPAPATPPATLLEATRGTHPSTSDPSFRPPPRLASGTERHATPASDRRATVSQYRQRR